LNPERGAGGRHDCKAVPVSLVDEDRSGLGRHDLPGELLGRFLAVFHSRGIAGILRDRRLTNEYLSSHCVTHTRRFNLNRSLVNNSLGKQMQFM